MSDGRQHERGGYRNGSEGLAVTDQVVREISALKKLSALEADRLVDLAEKMGEFLANRIRLRTGQIRKFVDAVNEMKSEGAQEKEANFFRSQCLLLKPKLAYAAGCQEEVKPLMAVLVPCLDRVHTKDDFIRFYRFVESIIAYHRYHGGRD